MTQTSPFTAREWVLLAAADLEAKGQKPFAAEILIVACWRQRPDVFGLKGYPQYPDSNRVLSLVMGDRGLVREGLLQKVGPKLYALTATGRHSIARLREISPP